MGVLRSAVGKRYRPRARRVGGLRSPESNVDGDRNFGVAVVEPPMTVSELERASDELRAAVELADGDERDRLETQADQLADLAETGADHGRLARHENALREIKAASGDDVGDRVDAAMDAITAYRETIEGV
jgi:hypothetical protein